MARLGREHLGDMSNEGQRVKERREHLGIGKKALAEQAGVNRNTLAAIEAGESFNRSSLAKIERVLDDLEAEAGIDAPPPPRSGGERQEGAGLVTLRMREEGIDVTVSGSVQDDAQLQEMILVLVERARQRRRERGGADATE